MIKTTQAGLVDSNRTIPEELLAWADALDRADRHGPGVFSEDTDNPEGTRFIRMSHTLAELWAKSLREMAETMFEYSRVRTYVDGVEEEG